jgi:hypothetical protein
VASKRLRHGWEFICFEPLAAIISGVNLAHEGKDDDGGEMLQGTLDLLILRTLLPGPAHGHTIAKSIERGSEDVLQVAGFHLSNRPCPGREPIRVDGLACPLFLPTRGHPPVPEVCVLLSLP